MHRKLRSLFSITGLLTIILLLALVLLGFYLYHGKTNTSTPLSVYTSGKSSDYRYIWTGSPGRQFTDNEFKMLADNYDLVIIEKGHGSGFADWDEAARRIKALNPHAKVLANFLTTEVNNSFIRNFGSSFNNAWILKDQAGKQIVAQLKGTARGFKVDLTNNDYRTYIANQVATRMSSGPYDGVMFDNFHPYSSLGWAQTQVPNQITQLDSGLNSLVSEIGQRIGSKLFLYNGIARGGESGSDRGDRGFSYLSKTSGSQDEFNCFLETGTQFRPGADIGADNKTYYGYAHDQHKLIIESVKIRTADSQVEQDHIKRYCFANYLMAFVPGYTFIQFKEFISQTAGPQIEDGTSAEQNLSLGQPLSALSEAGSIQKRQFQNGWVYVNLSQSPQNISAPQEVGVANGGVSGKVISAGSSYSIPPQDAVFFLNK